MQRVQPRLSHSQWHSHLAGTGSHHRAALKLPESRVSGSDPRTSGGFGLSGARLSKVKNFIRTAWLRHRRFSLGSSERSALGAQAHDSALKPEQPSQWWKSLSFPEIKPTVELPKRTSPPHQRKFLQPPPARPPRFLGENSDARHFSAALAATIAAAMGWIVTKSCL